MAKKTKASAMEALAAVETQEHAECGTQSAELENLGTPEKDPGIYADGLYYAPEDWPGGIVWLPSYQLFSHPDNPRKDLGDLSELAVSIRANGVLQNLTVVPFEGNYRMVIGHRRKAAGDLAGLTHFPCVINDMDYKTQLSTMLSENMQRSDLTVLEQADGFQTMLDLGVSMDELAAKSGFSKKTIQHRLKLRELDRKMLEDRVTKGATLMDLIKIEQIKDLKLKNMVLETVGTSNFEWKLKQALDKEVSDINVAKWLEFLSSFAEKLTSADTNSNEWGYVTYIDISKNPSDYPILGDRESTRYGYTVPGNSIYVYSYRDAAKKAEHKEPELTEREQRILDAEKSLLASSTTAYELRMAFIKKAVLPAKKINDAVAYMMRVMTSKDYRFGFSYPDEQTLEALFEIPTGLGWEKTREARDKALLEISALGLQQALPKMICCIVGDELQARYIDTYGSRRYPNHKANPELDAYYSFLEEIGYQISDEERLLMSGKHPLLQLAKDDPDPEDSEEEETDDYHDEDDDGEEDEE